MMSGQNHPGSHDAPQTFPLITLETKGINPSFDQKSCYELPATNQLWDLKDLVEAQP